MCAKHMNIKSILSNFVQLAHFYRKRKRLRDASADTYGVHEYITIDMKNVHLLCAYIVSNRYTESEIVCPWLRAMHIVCLLN